MTYDPAPPDSKASLSGIAAGLNSMVAGVGTVLIGTKVDDQEHCLMLDDGLHVPDSKHGLFPLARLSITSWTVAYQRTWTSWYLVEGLRLSKQSFLMECGGFHHQT